jgi:hypothetical protein
MMKRRELLKASIAVGICGSTLGCTPAQVVGDVEAVLKEAQSIMVAAGQTTWAAEFGTAAAALQAAYAVWDDSTTSTPGQKIAAALNAIVAATAAILPNDPYAPLIDELVALADLALSFWPAPAASTNAVRASRVVQINPHVNAVPPPKSYQDALTRWNTLAVGNLAGARIR